VRQNKNAELMAAGVTLVDPATTYIEPDVEIGADTVIHPGVVIEGRTRIGAACEIQAHVRIVDSTIGAHVAINNFCVIVGSTVATALGVFADAAARISRYLLMQFIVNASMGVAVGLGLYAIGVPYAALWGLVAGVMRYIPYFGPWIAALLPIMVSLVTAPGWQQVAIVVAMFVVLELLSNNVMEPLLYGQSVGLSPLAVIVAAMFWAWLWGPVGLVIATPITACLVVLSTYVPELATIGRLLGLPVEKQFGPEHERVLRAIAEHRLEGHVRAPGFVDAETLERARATALCLVLPSSREGYGLVVVEAAARGVPVVLVEGPDNAAGELVEDGVNGLVANDASADALADAIARVHAAGPELRASTAAWFRANAERLSLQSSLATVAEAYANA